MGSDLAIAFPDALAVWDLAASLAPFRADPLHNYVFPPTLLLLEKLTREAQEARLRATDKAQPALAAVSLAQLRLLRRIGFQADAYAGHSFGEFVALAAAGVLTEEAVLELAQVRGGLMAQAASAGAGAMTAVAGSREQTETVLRSLSSSVVIANDNAPDQVVLAGSLEELSAAEAALRAAGLASHRLAVAAAFHSPAMASACESFAHALQGFQFDGSTAPVYSNLTASTHRQDSDSVRASLVEQLPCEVRFREMLEQMYADGEWTRAHTRATKRGSDSLVLQSAFLSGPGTAWVSRP